jgi:hypothetical protein
MHPASRSLHGFRIDSLRILTARLKRAAIVREARGFGLVDLRGPLRRGSMT